MSSLHCLKKYDAEIDAKHEEKPLLITTVNAEIFQIFHGRNLIEEFQINEKGLSKIACMCPACPFFKKKFSGPTTPEGFQCALFEHCPKWLKSDWINNAENHVVNFLIFEAYFLD